MGGGGQPDTCDWTTSAWQMSDRIDPNAAIGAATNPGVGGGTRRRRATFDPGEVALFL